MLDPSNIWDHFKGPKFKGHKSRKMTAFKLKQTYYPSHPDMVAYRQALETFGEFKFNLPLSKTCDKVVPLMWYDGSPASLGSAQVSIILYMI